MVARWFGVMLGVWLAMAPRVLGYADAEARANDLLLGITLVLVSILGMASNRVRPLLLGLGVAIAVVPVVLGYRDASAALNGAVVGLLTALSSSGRVRRGVPQRPMAEAGAWRGWGRSKA